MGRHRRAFPRHRAPRRRQRLLRLLAPDAAVDPAGARPRTRRDDPVRNRYRRRSAIRRRRSDRARRRHQQPLPRQAHRPFPARDRSALQQVRLDGLDQAARRLHLHLPGDRVGAVHRPCLSVRGRPLDLDFRDRCRDLPARRARRPERTAIRRPHGRDFRLVPRRPSAADQPLDVAQFPDDPQPALGQGQHGAARRRQGDRAFLDRLRHQARDGRRDRARRRHGAGADGRCRVADLRARPARGGREDPARRRRVAGLVRACRPLLGFRSRAVRLRRHDPLQGDHLRQPHAARAGVRPRGRQGVCEAGPRQGLRRRYRQARGADVPAAQAARDGSGEPRRGVADVHVLGARRACPAISIWCITARARSAAPG